MEEDRPSAPGAAPAAPEHDAVLEALGFALWNEGRTDEAIALLERQLARGADGVPLRISAAPPAIGTSDEYALALSAAAPEAASALPRASFWEHFSEAPAAKPQPATQSDDEPASPADISAGEPPPLPLPAVLTAAAPAAPTGPRARRRLGRVAALFPLVFAVLGLWIGWGMPRIDLDQLPDPRPTVFVESADGAPVQQTGLYAGPVLSEELPEHLVDAVLAIEDRRFYDHFGLDVIAIARAAWRNLRAGAIVEGGSTITQQLAKVLFLTPEQTIRRKLQEALIAVWLDYRLSKDDILAKYLDSIYFGAGATGVSAAAEVYFDKPVSELDLAESAMLAGLIRSPSRLNPLTNLEAARARASIVLNSMVEAGFLARSDALAAVLMPAVPVGGTAVADAGGEPADAAQEAATEAARPPVDVKSSELRPAERAPTPILEPAEAPVAEPAGEPPEPPPAETADAEGQGSGAPALAAAEAQPEALTAEEAPAPAAGAAVSVPEVPPRRVARMPAPARTPVVPRAPEPEPEVARAPPEPTAEPPPEVARVPPAPEPEVARLPLQPQVAPPPDPDPSLVRTPPESAPGDDGPSILLGGRGVARLDAPRRQAADRRLAFEAPTILLGGRALDPEPPPARSRNRGVDGPTILLGGRGLP